MKSYVFVESNTTGTGALAVQRLLARGDAVTFLTRSREKYPFLRAAAPGLVVEDIETNDVCTVAAAVEEIQRRRVVDAVLTFSDFYVDIVAEAARRCSLRSLAVAAARTCRSKYHTRRALRAAGLSVPRFWQVSSEAEALAVALQVRYPCIVKPPCDSSSHGVRLVCGREELLAHYRTVSSWTENVRGQHLSGQVLIEELIDGWEYSVETFTLADGTTQAVGVTDKHLSSPPHFVEMGHDFPTRAPAAARTALIRAALRGLEAVGFDFGPAHTEIRLTARGPVIVEINPRLAGGMIPELVRYATGTDLLEAWLALLVGNEVDLTPRRQECASIRFLTAPSHGRMAAVRGLASARAVPGVRDAQLSREVGALVRPAEDAYDRLGFVIAAGPDARGVDRDLEAALDAIHLEVEAA